MTTEDYAVKIARDWNVPASGSGFVTGFVVRTDFLDGYRVEEAGGRAHREYGIPAEKLDAFNDAEDSRPQAPARHMRQALWTPPAEADLAAIDDYGWAIDEEIADRTLGHIRLAAEFLRTVPKGGALIEQGEARKWRAANTAHVLVYRLRDETVEILRVHHDRQDGRPG